MPAKFKTEKPTAGNFNCVTNKHENRMSTTADTHEDYTYTRRNENRTRGNDI